MCSARADKYMHFCLFYAWQHQFVVCATRCKAIAALSCCVLTCLSPVLALIEFSKLTGVQQVISRTYIDLCIYNILTSYIQLHRVALAVALAVAADARIDARPGATGVLQHEALIGHDNALGRVVLQYVALQRNESRVKVENWKSKTRADKLPPCLPLSNMFNNLLSWIQFGTEINLIWG